MKCVLISDTHLRHKRSYFPIPEGDILIHSGDACLQGDKYEVRDFFEWWTTLKAKHKIFVAGNHDWLFQKDPVLARSMVPKDTIYLQDSSVVVEGLKIYGSPWQPEFQDWAFNLPRGWPIRQKWEAIPSGIDILITHGPAMGFLDFSRFGDEHVGCADLRQELHRIKPKMHVYGHIHGDYGWMEWNGTLFVNAAICDEAYKPTHDPIVVEVTPEKGWQVISGGRKKQADGPAPMTSDSPLW